MPSPVLDLRAFKLALAGPSVFWHFPVFYVLLSSGLSPDPLRLFLLLIVLVVSAIWGFLVNDYFDRESDARSGRMDSVHGHGLSKPRMYFLILFSALLSWVIVFAIGGGDAFKVVLAVNYAIAFFYSAPPARFKIRRFWGFLANSLIERPLPILVLLAYMNFYSAATVVLPVLMELTWSVFKHQAADIRGDAEAGVTTLAVSLGEKRSNMIVHSFLNPASVVSLVALTALAFLNIPGLSVPLGIVLLAIPFGTLVARLAEKKGAFTVYFTRTDPPYIAVLNLSYRYLLLPVMAAGVFFFRPEYHLLVAFLVASLLFQALHYLRLLKSVPSARPGAQGTP